MATTTRKKKQPTDQVQVVKGTHLTVTTYPDGRTELQWDDEALEREVREAIASVAPTKKKRSMKAKQQ